MHYFRTFSEVSLVFSWGYFRSNIWQPALLQMLFKTVTVYIIGMLSAKTCVAEVQNDVLPNMEISKKYL